jgi:hypothetical protein
MSKPSILETMKGFAEQRMEKLSPLPMIEFPSMRTFKSMTWIGTFSMSNQQMRQRVIDADALVGLFPEIPQVPPEVARDYIRAKYDEPRRHTMAQYESINQPRAAPLYAKIGVYHDMAYVDLKAAYWSITKIIGWDVDYFPGRWLGKRSENDDFPVPENKVARNSLVSSALLNPTHVWTGEKLEVIKARSMYVNYDLWSCVMDVLHAIATIALKAGAVHVHTDGYIVPMKHAHLLIEEIHRWGLHAIIKDEGDCVVKGVGAYRIGKRRTKKEYHFKPNSINSVYTPDISFLKPRITALSKRYIDFNRYDDH